MRRREADREWKCEKRAATRGVYRVANQQRMAARRALEQIGTLKARLVLDMKYQTCLSTIYPGLTTASTFDLMLFV